MITDLLDSIRSVLGEPEFYRQMTSSSNYTWDYGAMLEYVCGVIILGIVICQVFKFLRCLVK